MRLRGVIGRWGWLGAFLVVACALCCSPALAGTDSQKDVNQYPETLTGSVTQVNTFPAFTDYYPDGDVSSTSAGGTVTAKLSDVKMKLDPTATEPGQYEVVSAKTSISGGYSVDYPSYQDVVGRTCDYTYVKAPGGFGGDDLDIFGPAKNGARVSWSPSVPYTDPTGSGPDCGDDASGSWPIDAAPVTKLKVTEDPGDGDVKYELDFDGTTQGGNNIATEKIKLKAKGKDKWWGGFCAMVVKSPVGDSYTAKVVSLFHTDAEGVAGAQDLTDQAKACSARKSTNKATQPAAVLVTLDQDQIESARVEQHPIRAGASLTEVTGGAIDNGSSFKVVSALGPARKPLDFVNSDPPTFPLKNLLLDANDKILG